MNAWWIAKGIPHVRANIEQFRREARRGQIVEMRYADHFLFLASTQDEVVRRTRGVCLSPPIVIPPHGEHTARGYLHEHSGGVTYPERARMIESGTYRVIWTGVLTSVDANGRGPEAPLEQRVSAPITIEVPPLTELIVAEAERLVRLLADAINDPAPDPSELAPYVLRRNPILLSTARFQYFQGLKTMAVNRREQQVAPGPMHRARRRAPLSTGRVYRDAL